jgi:raffinose/stachyose/melibiose transport system substrate-binding protein
MTDGQEPSSQETSDVAYGRREFLGRTGTIIAGTALAGSLTGVARATGVASAHAAAAKNLEVWYLTGSPQETKYITSLTAIYGGHRRLKTSVTPYDYDPMNQALKLALSSGRGPDVAYANPSPDDEFVYQKNKWIIDLNPLVKKYGWDKRMSPSVMNYWGTLCCDGNKPRTGIPFDQTAVDWFYNPKIFAKYGLKAPTTFAQLESLLATLKSKGITPIGCGGLHVGNPGSISYVFQQVVHQTTPRSVLQRLQLRDPTASWNIPGIVQAATIVQNWVKKGYLNQNVLALSGSDADAMFLGGETAMMINGTWKNQQYLAGTNFSPRFFPTPRIDTSRPWVMGGYSPNNVWMINAKAKSGQETAAKYLDYMLGEQVATTLWNNSDIPAYRFKKTPKPRSQLQADVYAAMSKTQTGFFIANVGGYFLTQYNPTLDKLWSLQISPQDLATAFEANYKQTLNG